MIELNLKVIDRTYPSGDQGGGTGGMSTTTGVTPSGKTTGKGANGAVTGTWTQTANGKWIFADRTYANEWAYINNPYADQTSRRQPGFDLMMKDLWLQAGLRIRMEIFII